MNRRVAFLDRSLGETRGVVIFNERPERLVIERPGDPESQRLGAKSIARCVAVERGLNLVFLRMADGEDAVSPMGDLVQGASYLVEVAAEPRAGKACVVRVLEAEIGPPRLVEDAPTLEQRLTAWSGAAPEVGPMAREWADEAQSEALETVYSLAGGGSIAIEQTRALTAIDVDLGERVSGDAARALRQANIAAIETSARLLRLKGLGGLVVFDLAGQGHNGPMLSALAKTAFAPDGPGVSIGPISRFGLFELALPWRMVPAVERLRDASGRLSAQSAAFALLRAIEREGRFNPGSRLLAGCAPEVGEAIKPYLTDLAGRIGPRFTMEVRSAIGREAFDVKAL